MNSCDDIPRRCRICLATPAELAIRAARDAVESVGADVLLTEAVILLGQALDKVADYVDAHPEPPAPAPEVTAHGFRAADGVTRAGFEAW
jgi:hypothetical protein